MDVVMPRAVPVDGQKEVVAASIDRWTPGILAALLLLVFGPVFCSPGRVASAPTTDAALYFAGARAFGFGQMRHGHLALWNPHQFSGMPFVGSFQAALLYPLNVIYLFLPLPLAMNLEMVLHLWLLGWGMFLWVRRRGLHPAAVLLASCLTVFAGPVFLRTDAGHLTMLDAVAWIPFVLLAVDLNWEGNFGRGMLLGTGAIAMQILAGHPQTVYITAIASGLYALTRLPENRRNWPRLVWLPVCFLAAAALAAAQLGAGIDAALDSTRQGNVPLNFAASYGLSFASLITFFVPGFFGGLHHFSYWGTWNAWEEAIFMGIFGFALTVYGACCSGLPFRRRATLLAVLMFVLALAPQTPLFPVLYHAVPGFSKFRAECRFAVPGLIFMALLAALGMDTLLRAPRAERGAGVAALLTSLLLALLGATMLTGGSFVHGSWAAFVQAIGANNTTSLPSSFYHNPDFIGDTAKNTAMRCFESAAMVLLLGLLLLNVNKTRLMSWAICGIALAEIVTFACGTRASFDINALVLPSEQQFLISHPGGGRIWQLAGGPNTATAVGGSDIWGYDPYLSTRYGAFMAWTQGQNPNNSNMAPAFTHLSPLYALLRLRYVFVPGPNGTVHVIEVPKPLPHLLLVSNWLRVTGRDACFAALGQRTFDPRRSVVLEQSPQPAPVPGPGGGTVRLVSSTPDSLTITADTPRPAILLITDAYARGWRAVALPGSVQTRYQLLPADDVLRAVPLAAGHHLLRVEYAPEGFAIGRIISLVSLIFYGLACVWVFRHRTQAAAAPRFQEGRVAS